MNISAVNTYNLKQNKMNLKTSNSSPSFGMVVSTKFIDESGKVITDPKRMRRAINNFIDIITQKGIIGDDLRSKLGKYVKDFDLTQNDNNYIIRDDFDDKKAVQDGVVHFFTGSEAYMLGIFGRFIGVVRARCYKEIKKGIMAKIEAERQINAQGKKYFDKMEEYLENNVLRPKKITNGVTGEKKEMGLCVFVQEKDVITTKIGVKRKRTRKSQELKIKDLLFREINPTQQPKKQIVPNETPTKSQQTPKQASEPIDRRTLGDWPACKTIPKKPEGPQGWLDF